MYVHPQYDQPESAYKDYDIALLKLKTPAQMTDYVSPPCLPDEGDFGDDSSFGPGMECYLSGWGKVGPGENLPVDQYGQPYKLRHAMLPLVDDQSCQDIYMEGANFEIQPKMQCAGGEGRTSCNGDSGGPLVCKKDDKYYQVCRSKVTWEKQSSSITCVSVYRLASSVLDHLRVMHPFPLSTPVWLAIRNGSKRPFWPTAAIENVISLIIFIGK